MSETKYKTFRDLRSVSKEPAKGEEKPSPAGSTSRTSTPSIAPERDFQRVPNSVTREAMPQGLFRGKSKQVYDYLYHQTRGAMTPKRSVRKSRKEILKGSGLGSMVTVDAAVDHLKNVGLLDVRPAVGSLNGNEYEVFTPEESSTSSTSTSSTTSLTQKVVVLDVLESSSTSITQTTDSIAGYSPPKTSFKTKKENLDDEAARRFFAKFQQAERELTGKTSNASEKWDELAEVLIAELKIAAGRTTISNVPAFMAEHLRRRLWKLDKKQAAREGKELPDQASATPSIPEGQTCPDCSNTGWWYPNGTEKGVARCTHLKLQSVLKDEENA
jgi:hypothetical protein